MKKTIITLSVASLVATSAIAPAQANDAGALGALIVGAAAVGLVVAASDHDHHRPRHYDHDRRDFHHDHGRGHRYDRHARGHGGYYTRYSNYPAYGHTTNYIVENTTYVPYSTQYNTTQYVTANEDDGGYCREFTQRVNIGGNATSSYGTACLQPDGSWKIQK